MKYKIILLSVGFFLFGNVQAQFVGESFGDQKYYAASSQYIDGKLEVALQTVNEGLQRTPSHQKLQELKKLLEKEKQEQQQKQDQQKQDQQNQDQKDQQDQQQQDQQNKDQQNKDQQEKDQQEKENQEKKDQEQQQEENEESQDESNKKDSKEEESKEQDENSELQERLKEMNLTEDKAKMILEAMKNSEKQYLQQLKRKAQKKNTGKPDW